MVRIIYCSGWPYRATRRQILARGKKMKDSLYWIKYRCWLLGAVILVLVIALVGLIGSYYTTDKPVKPKAKISDYSERRLERTVEHSSGVGISGLKIDKRSGLVTVFYLDDDAHDENAIMFDLSLAGVRIMPSLFKISGVNTVKVVEIGTFLDNAGNSSIDQSAAITISRKKADMIDWDKVNDKSNAGLIAEATELDINPTIKSEIDDLDVLNAIIVQLSNKHE